MSQYRQFLPLSLLLLLGACYQPTEDCLDPEAVNYSVVADRNDPAKCLYPELRLAFRHRYTQGDTILPLGLRDSVYYDQLGQPFRINQLRYYLSNIRLVFEDGSESEMERFIEVELPQASGGFALRPVEDNFALVSPRTTRNYVPGRLRRSGRVSELRFALGIEGLVNLANPESFPDNHPLRLVDSTLHFNLDSGYVFQYMEIFRDTIAADTIPLPLRVGTTPYLQEIRLPLPFEKIRGFHTLITLEVDYSLWFSGINARQDSPQALIQKIVANQAQSFRVQAVELSN
jgi:uncharacterized protein (DUF3820 family)